MKTRYFAYGSNMSTKHLHSRVASARPVGYASLENRRVLFNKSSKYGSGKANLVDSPGDVTWGVLYEIDTEDLDKLDRIEVGYNRVSVQVRKPDGDIVVAATYISTNLTDEPVAYDWYKKLVLSGAREHNLPTDHIVYIEQLPSKPDRTKSKVG